MCEPFSEKATFENPNHPVDSFKRMQELLSQEKFCDIEIVIKNYKYAVHGVVLASSCDYFIDVVNQQRNLNNKIEINFQNIDDEIMRKIIEYCYTGKIEIKYNDIIKIIDAAGILQIKYLLNITKDMIKSYINVNNCFNFLNAAINNSFSDVEDYISEFIRFNFTDVMNTNEFLEIDHRQFIEFLKYDDLNVTDERKILNGVKRWISHNFNERKTHSYSLMELVKLPLLPSEILFDEINSIYGKNGSSSLFLEAIQWQTIANRRPQLSSFRTKERQSGCVVLAIGDWFLNTSSVVLMYNPTTKIWSDFANIETTLCNFSSIIVGDDLIILGGFIDNLNYQNTVECYNLKTNKKSVLPNMLEKRNRPCVGVIDGYLYAVGGNDGAKILNSAERYNLKTCTWKHIESMSTPRNESTGIVFENELYVIGGKTGTSSTNSVEVFCPKTGKWRFCEPTHVARTFTEATVANGYIYIVGGVLAQSSIETYLNSCERYDPKIGKWTMIANMHSSKFGVALSAIGNNLIAFGGSNGSVTLKELEEYDTSADKWIKLTSTHQRGHATCISLPKSYIKRIKPNAFNN